MVDTFEIGPFGVVTAGFMGGGLGLVVWSGMLAFHDDYSCTGSVEFRVAKFLDNRFWRNTNVRHEKGGLFPHGQWTVMWDMHGL